MSIRGAAFISSKPSVSRCSRRSTDICGSIGASRLNVDLETRSLEEVGDDAYRSIFSRIPARGLDRNDNYYYAATGPENWARVMMAFLSPEDRSSCLIGYDSGEPVGIVGLSAFDEDDTGHDRLHRGRSRLPRSGLGSTIADGRDRRRAAAGLQADPVGRRRAQHPHADGDGRLRSSARSAAVAPLGPLAETPVEPLLLAACQACLTITCLVIV